MSDYEQELQLAQKSKPVFLFAALRDFVGDFFQCHKCRVHAARYGYQVFEKPWHIFEVFGSLHILATNYDLELRL